MSDFLLHAHSGWRWIVLITLLLAIFKGFQGWKKNAPFEKKDLKIALFAMIAYHIQFLGGLILIFTGPHMGVAKYFKKMLMEHVSLMVIGMVFITIGYVKAKKALEDKAKYKSIFIFYLITLILVLAAIPWPFRSDVAANWF